MNPPAAPSKAKKILKRTLSGARLVAGLSLILWLTSLSRDGEPVFFAAVLVLVAALVELARMGRCRALHLPAVLSVTAVGLFTLHFAALRADRRAERQPFLGDALSGVYREDLLFEYAWVALSVVVAYGLWKGAWWRPRFLQRARVPYALGVLALVAFVVTVTRDPLQAAVHARFALFALGITAACMLPVLWLQGTARELVAVVGLALWLVPPLFCLWHVWRGWGSSGLVALLVLSKIGDTAGYYVGSSIGKRHPFPNISPGKTVAGCVASFVAATSVGGALSFFGVLPVGSFGIAGGLVCGAALNVAAQSGDLFESWVKRRAEVKDSSTWFGPSGGLLDQLDSLLFSIPIAVVLWPWLFPI